MFCFILKQKFGLTFVFEILFPLTSYYDAYISKVFFESCKVCPTDILRSKYFLFIFKETYLCDKKKYTKHLKQNSRPLIRKTETT